MPVRFVCVVVLAVGCGGASSSADRHTLGGPSELPPEECTATLRIESMEEAEPADPLVVEIPRARITAVRHCERSGSSQIEGGLEDGVCTRAGPRGEGVIAHVSCWWAGAGSEIELVRRGDALVVRRAVVDEERGPATAEELGALGLPENSRLVPLEAAGD